MMLIRYKYLILLIISIVVILNSCSSVQPKLAQKVEVKKVIIQPKNVKVIKSRKVQTPSIYKSYLPDWIMNTNRDGYICNIGSALLDNNLGITKKIATIQAKANISQDIQSYISTQSKLETNCKNQECKEKFSSKINITSTQMIKNVKIINQYTDTKKGIYYIHLCTKIQIKL